MTRIAPSDERLILDAALAEYHALYRLAEYRLVALDRRIPLIGGLLTAFLGSVPVLPGSSQLLALIAIPVSLIWLVRTTINHARSFEDALRRIEWHEHAMNRRLGVDVMGFQRSHPSKGSTVGGRKGSESVYAVTLTSGILLLTCAGLALYQPDLTSALLVGYGGFLLVLVGSIASSIRWWRAYHYIASRHDL